MKRTVLLIEDNHQNRYLATFLLEKADFKVIAASDGPVGIELARKARPDVILLDIQLPSMDGYKVAATLRGIGDLQSTPIIAVTSYAMVGDREKAIASGCNGYLEKPINPETFVPEILSYLPPLPT